MSDFLFYLKQGIGHITNPSGIDHMVFVITLCAVYRLDQWRQLLVLVTAFTIGHSLTLALSASNIIHVSSSLVEFLIPVTILLTSIYNVSIKQTTRKFGYNYLLALFFGLIHGMGFSNYFRAMMTGIDDSSILKPLFSFNVGIEMGQLLIVSVFMLTLFCFTKFMKVAHRDWNLYISGAGGGLAFTMIIKSLL